VALTIWHNPRCSKSRQTLALLEERGLAPEIRLYLQDTPDHAELRSVLEKLGQPASALVRWKEADLPEELTKDSPEDVILDALVAQPKLIERPLVQTASAARLGRPPEAVLEIV